MVASGGRRPGVAAEPAPSVGGGEGRDHQENPRQLPFCLAPAAASEAGLTALTDSSVQLGGLGLAGAQERFYLLRLTVGSVRCCLHVWILNLEQK